VDWQTAIHQAKPDMNRLVAGWEPLVVPRLVAEASPQMNSHPLAGVVDNLLSQTECDELIRFMQLSPSLAPVNYQGNPKNANEKTGSIRTNIWSPELAESIWKKLSPFIQPLKANELTLTDWWQGDRSRTDWRPVAVSPLMRFMRYENHGKHWPHYDAGFIYPDNNLRSLMSLVIYLTCHQRQGGETRMLDDKQSAAIWLRDHSDWTHQADDSDVRFTCSPQAGRALVFLHRQCHDVAEYTGDDPRIIIRTDIIFEFIK
jgi:2OG-Fe(II) oxygenase superfamily